MKLGTKLIYNLVIFQEYKLLHKCTISCELLPRKVKEASDIGCMHLANSCSGNVILVHCDQIQDIGWERKSHRENLYLLQALKLGTTNDNFLASNNWPHNKSMPLMVYIKNNGKRTVLPSILSECSQYLLIQTQYDCRWHHLHNWCSPQLYLTITSDAKIIISFFLHLTAIRHNVFPTLYL